MTLEEAIDQMITLGHKDPLDIARRLEQQQGRDWVAGELLARAEDIISEIARHHVNAERRRAQSALSRALRADKMIDQAAVRLVSVWLPSSEPGGVWKPLNDWTIRDLEVRARFMDGMAVGMLRQAQWFRELRDRMEAAGAQRVRDYTGEIPTLPDDEDIELPPLERPALPAEVAA